MTSSDVTTMQGPEAVTENVTFVFPSKMKPLPTVDSNNPQGQRSQRKHGTSQYMSAPSELALHCVCGLLAWRFNMPLGTSHKPALLI